MRRRRRKIKDLIQEQTPSQDEVISTSLTINKEYLDQTPNLPGLTVREITIFDGRNALVTYIDNISDTPFISQNVLSPLLSTREKDRTVANVITVPKIRLVNKWKDIETHLLQGSCLLFLEGDKDALLVNALKTQKRKPMEPANERTIRGSHIGFIESLEDNISMLRHFLTSDQLRIQYTFVGKENKTKIGIVYLENLANPEALEELMTRIEGVKYKTILDSGELEQMIEDNPYSIFPQFLASERPDSVAADLLQGRYAIIVDRSPSVIVGPINFNSFFQSIDDYSSRWISSSFIRILRFISFVIAIFLPSFYIAIISFHYEILPLELLLSIGQSRREVPFPPIIEAFLMEFILEMLREAGLRLPKSIGQTVGIVGGIIIGQSAVEAGIVSNIMVIVVAMTAISSFVMPNPEMAFGIRFIRFPMMLVASFFGMVGIIIGFMVIVMHLVSLESLGTPYGIPFGPLKWKDLKDSVIRFPLWAIEKVKTSRSN
ncbi:spore germination protein [Guptibacillus algicola]|uniref:spore germination protein n=1 Tax=Guptibacillus algicola TaxID=225844 RepID=UPI001CD7A2D5|nr:spore germination protein [Alkalihalobacillus algicola]MCA0988359.1 spore germination protein [Alkalihalobacillus algicola]